MADDVEARAIRRIKELFSQPKQKLVGDTVALSDVSGSVKPVIFEFGFPAYVQGSIQPDKQHRALYEVWNGGTSTPTSGLKDALNLGFCIRGAASQRVGFLRGKSNTNTCIHSSLDILVIMELSVGFCSDGCREIGQVS